MAESEGDLTPTPKEQQHLKKQGKIILPRCVRLQQKSIIFYYYYLFYLYPTYLVD